MHRWKKYIEELEADRIGSSTKIAVLKLTIERQNVELARLRQALARKDGDE